MILAPISPGELADKISILQIKCDRIVDPDKLVNCTVELRALREAWAKQLGNTQTHTSLPVLLKKLDAVNKELWDLENKARLPRYKSDNRYWTMKDRAAMAGILFQITNTNDSRAAYKRAISQLLGSDLIEEKSHNAQ